MSPDIFLLIFFGILFGIILLVIAPFIIGSIIMYRILLVRTSPEKWSRTCSWENEEQQRMFDEGKEWGDKYEEKCTQVSINSEGFRLVGEYFDFGNNKVVIIIPGRMESGTYSYYFAEPYRKAGYNVLAVDNRSHGLSEGKYNCVGLVEYVDILHWIRFAHDTLNNEKVVIHGICIGSATGLNAIVNEECPSYVSGFVADGMYINFKENFKNHLIERRKPVFPFTDIVMKLIEIHAKVSPTEVCPLNQIRDVFIPILFIYSKEDIYSTPENGQLLFDKCRSPHKRIQFFEHGEHSHVRINNVKKYDETIINFLKEELNH